MKLLPRRKPGASLTFTPDRPLLPTESVTATVTLADQIDNVAAAQIELGYVNTYKYEWAQSTYNSPGGFKDAEDWVAAGDTPLTFAGGSLMAGTHSATLRIPSWAPPSADPYVRWVARLVVEGKGKAPEAEGTFTVLAPLPDEVPTETRLVQGERAIANDIVFDLRTEKVAYRLGEEVRGTISVTPRSAVTKSAKADIRFYRPQVSHPLERKPAPHIEWFTRPHITIAEDLALAQGVTTELPFAVRLPDEGEPSLEAVHNSIEWWVVATITFAGMTGAIEKVRREIFVYNA
ncbi:MAG: hypothetical protein ABIN55_06820 [Aeromicrobium sp.]